MTSGKSVFPYQVGFRVTTYGGRDEISGSRFYPHTSCLNLRYVLKLAERLDREFGTPDANAEIIDRQGKTIRWYVPTPPKAPLYHDGEIPF